MIAVYVLAAIGALWLLTLAALGLLLLAGVVTARRGREWSGTDDPAGLGDLPLSDAADSAPPRPWSPSDVLRENAAEIEDGGGE